MKHAWFLVAAVCVSLCGISIGQAAYEHGTTTKSSSPKKPQTSQKTSENQRAKRIEEKLAQILANQTAIQDKLGAVKSELQIIKVRATSRGAIQ